MEADKKTQHTKSFRRITLLSMSAIALPLFLIVILFEWNTVRSHQASVNAAFGSTLSAYGNMVDNSADTVQHYIVDTVANNIDFQMIVHAKNKTEAYLSAIQIEKQCRPLLQAHELLGGFYVYASSFDYCHAVSMTNYPHIDRDKIQTAVIKAAAAENSDVQWAPLSLSDRTVFLYTYVKMGNAFSVILDPAQQTHTGLEPDSKIFFTEENGTPFAPETAFGTDTFPAPADWRNTFRSNSGEIYDLVSLPLHTIHGYIVYAVPHKSFFGQLNSTQRFLMIITLCLLISIPVCWLLLRSLLLQPLSRLTKTTQAIKAGHTDTRVPRDSKIYEVNAIAETVNTMLDTIQLQKIDAYERELSIRDLQLQYLQLQLRPHFFLNCLNLIYSLAEEKKYDILQELTLDLSAYFRNIFKGSSKLVTLSSEITSIEHYIRIQGAGTQFPPCLDLSMESDTADILIPSISILTFVENAVKHADPIDDPTLLIHIKCNRLDSEEGSYLYVTICDNGGGFPPEKLTELNNPHGSAAEDGHIGISNIRCRLHFLYGERATVSFRNRSDGACVELFLPIDSNLTGGVNP